MKPRSGGAQVPSARFMVRRGNDWEATDSERFFADRTVVLFALPGAFTPVCSTQHLPRYDELNDSLKANGVDEVACLSVNDPYVMEQWADQQGVRNLTLVADGNAEFTEGMGMLEEFRDRFLGPRSRRYSMLVRDGVIERVFVESLSEDDPLEVSDADTMLQYLNPDARGPELFGLLTREGCPYCARAKRLLEERGLQYEEVVIGRDVSEHALRALSAADSVPQVFVTGTLIGGTEELQAYLAPPPGDAGQASASATPH